MFGRTTTLASARLCTPGRAAPQTNASALIHAAPAIADGESKRVLALGCTFSLGFSSNQVPAPPTSTAQTARTVTPARLRSRRLGSSLRGDRTTRPFNASGLALALVDVRAWAFCLFWCPLWRRCGARSAEPRGTDRLVSSPSDRGPPGSSSRPSSARLSSSTSGTSMGASSGSRACSPGSCVPDRRAASWRANISLAVGPSPFPGDH